MLHSDSLAANLVRRDAFEGLNATTLEILSAPELDVFFRQAALLDRDSAWFGHIPFAHWLMRAARPGVLVELGTHAGLSYVAFCQAVEAEGLNTRCFAVDTWEGDKHAGYYAEDIFSVLSQYHDSTFSAFSQLLRSTFDAAADMFADGSIDLLHIDGLHTYEAVKHDFERWLPKLSDRAVVLFHDTNERRDDFGVWRLWAEVSARWPGFEFPHCHGLGMLCVGSNVPEGVRELFALSEAQAATVKTRFARLGARWEMEAKTHLLARLISAREADIAALGSQVGSLKAELGTVSGEVAALRAEVAALTEAKRDAEAANASGREKWAAARVALRAAQHDLAANQRDLVTAREALAQLQQSLAQQNAYVAALLNSTSWRLTQPIRAAALGVRSQRARVQLLGQALRPGGAEQRAVLKRSLRRRFGRPAAAGAIRGLSRDEYLDWVAQFDTLSPEDREAIKLRPSDSEIPKLLVLICVNSETGAQVMATVSSLRAQLRDNWRGLICCGRDCPASLRRQLESGIENDARFATAYQPKGTADWLIPAHLQSFGNVVVVAAGIVLREHALYSFAVEALGRPNVRLIYADEDQLGPNGLRQAPFFKPDFSPELLRSLPYFGRCYLLRDASRNWGNLLRRLFAPSGLVENVSRLARAIPRDAVHHIPSVLFHDYVPVAIPDQSASPPMLDDPMLPRVSIIIPTRNGLDVLEPCLLSIRRMTSYPAANIEVVVVDNGSDDPETLQFLADEASAGSIRLLPYPKPFNYSAINNYAVSQSAGELLVFLNNDTEVIFADWLRVLAAYAMQRDVGAVGAKLLYPDRTIQHGGVIVGIQGVGGHAHVGLGEKDPGYFGLARLSHEVSAVTGACLAIRRSVLEQIGGFDENLAVAFNDVLLCLKATADYRNMYVGHPLLIHHESKSRGFDNTPEKLELFRSEARYTRRAFSRHFKLDPYYNGQLSLESPYKIAFPPRTSKPWRSLARRDGAKLRILILSTTHQIGHGVAVVLNLQANYLANNGFEVFIGGPLGTNEFSYETCTRVILNDHVVAACFAVEHDIDCVIAQTPPFFSTFRWLGEWPRSIAYDHGEPPPELFPDAQARRDQVAEKRFAIAMADRAFAISRAVQAEADLPKMDVIRLGNSHLAVWNDALASRRAEIRASLDLERSIVILNVCRFHRGERCYKGVDRYAEVAGLFAMAHPTLAENVVFALAGKADPIDVEEMKACGLRVYANLPDDELIDLYAAADVYMSFSQWEGYNLGIGQALALGLPVIASDLPAHREFPIATTDNTVEAVGLLADLIAGLAENPSRRAIVSDWNRPLEQLAAAIREVCEVPMPAVLAAAPEPVFS